MKNLATKIMEAAETSFVDDRIDSIEAYRPKLLYNDYRKGNTVLASLEKELRSCETFWFSVAFVTKSGLIVLKETLKDIKNKGIRGRILTTDYLTFNEPGALRELLEFSNLEVKVYTKEHFHTKGYMFQKGDKRTFVVGSSNLTQGALKENKEWNMRVTSLEQGELIKETIDEFNHMWDEAEELDHEWINAYEELYKESKKGRDAQKIVRIKKYQLQPNVMQIAAIRNLEALRESGERKALLISATGTGKTYLSAFDVRNFGPTKMLFLVHREQILKQAMESFKDVIGPNINAKILSGNSKNYDADYLFSTVQMMSKTETLEKYSPEYFDYICIDETHRSGASSYQKILQYFNPQFLLGMTASPERTDGYDIYQLFDHNIAYEIRLQQAMEEHILCPFHYFGVSELEINGQLIDDKTEFCYLISEERVANMIQKIEFYGYSGNRVRGLIFTSTKKEAYELSNSFNIRGYHTQVLTGEDSLEEREEAIKRLEQEEREDGLDYIFTVDIFNEGVDIPCINQIVMIRPTESAIIFVQQIGRGLRKAPDKEYVVIIDFIGNYTKNFLIPIALSGDRTYNKDTIRKYIAEGNRVIPGCSTINFDAISKERIYESINATNFTTLKLLREEYTSIKYKLGRIPMLIDFYENGAVDPKIILDYAKSYHKFLQKVEKEYTVQLTEKEEKMLEFVSVYFASGKRPHELVIIKMLMDKEEISRLDIISELALNYGIENDEESVDMAIEILQGGFLSGSDKTNYSSYPFIEYGINTTKVMVKRCMSYYKGMKNIYFNRLLKDVITYGLRKYEEKYYNRYLESNLVLYEKYSRKDVCRLLNWKSDESSVMYGYKVKYGTCPIFVTYNKREDISGSTKYEDRFANKSVFSWMTRSRMTLESGEVQQILKYQQNNLKIHLFVKKADGEGRDFYYLGETEPILKEVKQMTIRDDKGKNLSIVNIPMKMMNPVRDDVYEYLVE